MQPVAKSVVCGSLKTDISSRRTIMVMMVDVHHNRKLFVYGSFRCVACSELISGGDPHNQVQSRIVPVDPETYASYFCHDCFIDLPIEKIIAFMRTYLSTEPEIMERRRKIWKEGGATQDAFSFLEHSVKFLRGHREDPPFICAIFSLHEKYIKGYPPIRYRGHLALISLK